MIFGDLDVKAPVRKLANQFGVDFEQVGSYMVDNTLSKDVEYHRNTVFSDKIFDGILLDPSRE